MRFTVETKTVNGAEKQDSNLHLVLADGHAVAESQPKPREGVELADTRTLRSEHIELEMKPDGKDLQKIRTTSQSQLEFKPNRPTSQHRTVDASHLRVLYGEGSYADTFLAWNVATKTDRQPKGNAHREARRSRSAASCLLLPGAMNSGRSSSRTAITSPLSIRQATSDMRRV